MLDLIFDDVAKRLYCMWVYENHPDAPVGNYYDTVDMASQLTHELLKPFRKQLIETIMTLAMEDSEAQQIQYLYTTYNDLNDPDCVEAMIIEMYLFLMEQYLMPFHAFILIIDGAGTMLFTAEEPSYD